jgi:hypothetical protein
MAANVALGGLDRRFGALTHAGHRVQRLLQFQGDLSAQGLGFLAHQ